MQLTAKPSCWLPGALSDARQVILLRRYSNLPAHMIPRPCIRLLWFRMYLCDSTMLVELYCCAIKDRCHIHTTPASHIIKCD